MWVEVVVQRSLAWRELGQHQGPQVPMPFPSLSASETMLTARPGFPKLLSQGGSLLGVLLQIPACKQLAEPPSPGFTIVRTHQALSSGVAGGLLWGRWFFPDEVWKKRNHLSDKSGGGKLIQAVSNTSRCLPAPLPFPDSSLPPDAMFLRGWGCHQERLLA